MPRNPHDYEPTWSEKAASKILHRIKVTERRCELRDLFETALLSAIDKGIRPVPASEYALDVMQGRMGHTK